MGDAENCTETAPPARKVIGRPYVKGQPSSNHSGRPKQLPEMRFKFRSYSDEALSALVKALKQPRYRVQAAATILASPHDCGATPAAAPREVPRMRPAPPPDLLTLDADAMATRIMMSMPPEKADRIVAALNQRLVHWRVGTFDPKRPYVTGGGVHRWCTFDNGCSRQSRAASDVPYPTLRVMATTQVDIPETVANRSAAG